jgi:hypothetical protein
LWKLTGVAPIFRHLLRYVKKLKKVMKINSFTSVLHSL